MIFSYDCSSERADPKPGVNNTGFVVGDQGVQLIDAHFTVAMAHQIQHRIREVTDKPPLYLNNLNYLGAHTFDNCANDHPSAGKTDRSVLFMEENKDFMIPFADPVAVVVTGRRRCNVKRTYQVLG